MLYKSTETKTSQNELQTIFRQLKGESCLLGGWAVYHIVNRNFKKATGREYVDSRDIDLGFHINKDWNEEQLKNSEFSHPIRTVCDKQQVKLLRIFYLRHNKTWDQSD